MGWRPAARLPGIFLEAAKKLKVGQSSDILRSPAGFHIILLIDKRGTVKIRFAVVAECRPEYGRRRRNWSGRNRRPGKDCGHGQRDHAVQGGMRSAELKNGTAPKEFGTVF
jgi:hypothetical protein